MTAEIASNPFGAAAGVSLKAPLRKASRAKAKPRAKRKPAAGKGVASKGVAAQQARARGFALDLAQGGPDADDANFKEYA